jgi:hypothetical protein
MVLVCLVAFFVPVAGDMQLDPLTQAMISSFIAIIGIVIPSYFGATAYVHTREAPTTTEASTQREEVKREGDALEEGRQDRPRRSRSAHRPRAIGGGRIACESRSDPRTPADAPGGPQTARETPFTEEEPERPWWRRMLGG